MTKMIAATAALLAWAATAGAQMGPMDFGVASEVVRSLTSERTAIEIQQSTNLLASYRDVAIQQDLAQEAVRRGLTERVDVQRTLEQYRRQVLVQALCQDIERRVPQPTDEQIAAAYKERTAGLQLPPAYQMDAWMITPADTQSLALARSFASGKPVADETVSVLTAPRILTADENTWVNAGQMSSNVWSGLMAMQLSEVKLFPDGSNTMVVRRGPFRAPRPLTLDEARPLLIQDLRGRQAAEQWQAHLEKTAREIGLTK